MRDILNFIKLIWESLFGKKLLENNVKEFPATDEIKGEPMSNLSPHFSLIEMSRSDYAARNGIDNTPDELVLLNLSALCKNVLEPLREIVKKPIHINSGYRSPKVNAAIGGALNSQHVEGKAADIVVDGMSIDELFDIACKFINFDQCISEFNSWVHISYNGDKNRKQILWAVKRDGKTQYLTEKP